MVCDLNPVGAWPEGDVVLVSVGRDSVRLALTWRLHGTESMCRFLAGFFFSSCFPNVFFMFYKFEYISRDAAKRGYR